jgi:predicted Zn-ribbon and HTH transcriptional regulator
MTWSWMNGSWGSNGNLDLFMFRKALIDLLLGNPMAITQIARTVNESPGDVADDLNHLLLSLKHTHYRAVIEPAKCRACGFVFSEEKLNKPSKCPECHSSWIFEPRIAIERKS